MAYDLPTGGKRMLQNVDGFRYTIVGGEVIVKDGVMTDAMPGRLVRGPQKAVAIGNVESMMIVH